MKKFSQLNEVRDHNAYSEYQEMHKHLTAALTKIQDHMNSEKTWHSADDRRAAMGLPHLRKLHAAITSAHDTYDKNTQYHLKK